MADKPSDDSIDPTTQDPSLVDAADGASEQVEQHVRSQIDTEYDADAIQVLGGAGYTADFPVERYFREAKVTQIFEGTNQIQRLVISRNLLRSL